MRLLMIGQSWFAEELRRAGHEVVVAAQGPQATIHLGGGPLHLSTILESMSGRQPEAIIIHDTSSMWPVFGLATCDIPVAFYSVDTHHHHEIHGDLACLFDMIFCAQKKFMPGLQARGVPVNWLPAWSTHWMEPAVTRDGCPLFVGTLDADIHPERADFFRRLQAVVPIEVTSGSFWELFPQREIVLNQTVRGDLNFRVFEAMMSGALLLTESGADGLDELFEDGRELLTYPRNDAQAAAEIILSLQADRERARRIGRAGRERIIQFHQPTHRAQIVASCLETLTRHHSGERLLAAMVHATALGWSYERDNLSWAQRSFQEALLMANQAADVGCAPNPAQRRYLAYATSRWDALTNSNQGITTMQRFFGDVVRA